ncbi:DNA-binding CsgD family transcriptional regulator [Streptacidiphilus sp. MAP12-20]|uniref:helix-turn-helix transcriptional regulator n=1 Tax=Streptacidiphilus sp. MAP12-20 TaxID=3156299 RepID=UPI003513FB94
MTDTENPELELDDLAVVAYRSLLEADHGIGGAFGLPPDQADLVFRRLAELRVIESKPDRSSGWRAVEPSVALAKLVLPIEAEIRRRSAQADRLRTQLQALVPVHDSVTGAAARRTIEVVADERALLTLVEDELAKCRDSVVLQQPDSGSRGVMWGRCVGPLLDARARGVDIRSLFQHGSRYHLPTEGLVETLGAVGARFRTTDELPVWLAVFDRNCCLLLPEAGQQESGEAAAAVVVRHPLTVELLLGLFAGVWDQALPFTSGDPQPAQVTDQVKRSILRLLALGAKDEVVARRLGLSVRTCRRHIADLMGVLDAGSRFQAGVAAEALGLLRDGGGPIRSGRADQRTCGTT